MFELRLASIQVSISTDKCLRSLLALLFNSDLSSRDHSITQCCLRFDSEQSLHTHSPSREETIEYLTYYYEMELLYEYDLGFCAQIIRSPKQTTTLTLLLTTYMPTLPYYPGVYRIRHQSPCLPYGSPYLPDKIIFRAFLCLSLRFSPFLAQNLNFSYT